jgi:hypothetical protein
VTPPAREMSLSRVLSLIDVVEIAPDEFTWLQTPRKVK